MMTTSRFERMKKKLNKSKESTKGTGKVHETPDDGGSFDRIKARLQELEAHQKNFEASLEAGENLHHQRNAKPEFNDIIKPTAPEEGQASTSGDEQHTMPNPYTDLSTAPKSTIDETEFSLEESLNDQISVEFDRDNAPSLSAKETLVHFDSSDDTDQIAATPERRVPQLSLDHMDHGKPSKDAEYTSSVKTLIKLVNELPEGVTKQTGAQIIRLTMEAMGIVMEDVLSEAQGAQSEMLEAVRGNIKKIEEYKTVIRKLESDIKYYQGRANELSEIIDLFILSSTTKHSNDMA
jgi:hypothetical protein